MAKLVSKVYGDALFESAMDKQVLDSVYDEVRSLETILQENPDLLQFLTHPQIMKEEKVQVLKDIFSEKLSDELMGFLTIIVNKGRENELSAIFNYFINTVREYRKIGKAYVTSAVELKDDQKKQIKDKLLATTDYIEFEMNYLTDPSLIGGLIIRIGDRVVDSSVKTRLYDLTRDLLKVQLA